VKIGDIPVFPDLEQFKYYHELLFFMKKTFARALSKKQIMSTDGMVMGTIKNITFDLHTGQVIDLVVKPDQNFETAGYAVEADRMFVPFEAVRDIKDYIVVDRYLSKK